MITRIEIGPELVASDATVDGLLNVDDPTSRNLFLFPLGNGVRANVHGLRERGLRTKELADNFDGRVVHMENVIHRRLSDVNRRLIDDNRPSDENKQMVDTPKPEHYSSFKDWLDATRRTHGLNKAQLAEIAGKSPQAVTKWYGGGSVDPEPLRKLADWSGVEYAALRLLLEGQPLNGAKRRKLQQPTNLATMRIARKIEVLTGDDDAISSIEALIDHHLTRLRAGKKQGKPAG